MKRLLYVLSLIALTLSATMAVAQCVVRSRAAAVVNTAAVVTPAVAVAPVVQIPAYGASFDSSGQEIAKLKEQIAALESRLVLLESARDSHNGRLAVLEGKAGVASPAPQAAPAADSSAKPAAATIPPQGGGSELPVVYVRSCIKCHQAGRNPKGGLALVDATGKKLAPLTSEQRLDVLRRINLAENDPGVMPPKGKGEPVNDKEASEILEVLTRAK